MQKKSTTYFLVSVVLVIWGIVSYKLFANIPDEDNIVVKLEKVKTYDFENKRDTFSIVANYRDPFLGTLPRIRKVRSNKHRFEVPKKVELIWPDIKYKGAIIPKKGKALFLVDIDNRGYLLKKNEEKNDIKLLKGNKEYIIVKYKGKTKKVEK